MKDGKASRSLCAIILLVLSGLVLAFMLAGVAFAEGPAEVGSRELIERPDDFDGRSVTYTGEIVGEILRRGEYAWINVNDDEYGDGHIRKYEELKGTNTGICIYCRAEMVEDVSFIGSYNASGDKLRITGTFYKASPEHGGALMIEAQDVSVVREGHKVTVHRLGNRLLVVLALVVVSFLLWVVWRGRVKRASKP